MKYHTGYADPPWGEYGGGKIKRGADRHYPLMTKQEIIDYLRQIEFEDDAHLYEWVTNNHLEEGLEVMKALGFRYVHQIAWVKTGGGLGLGQYFRGGWEPCLFGVRGHLPYAEESSPGRSVCTETDVIFAKRREHSRKPDEMYAKIEKTSPPPYIEAFAREKREGWDAIGNELPETSQSLLKLN